MRRRLYFLLPDLGSAIKTANDLLLARVEDSHMHFLAKRGMSLGQLHEANTLQKSDCVHGAELGFVLGGAGGFLIGIYIYLTPPDGVTLQLVTVLISTVIGAVFGAWAASLVAMSVPNTRLKRARRGKGLRPGEIVRRSRVQFRKLPHQRRVEQPGGDVDDQSLCRYSLIGLERFFIDRVAENVEAHRSQHLRSAPPEQLLPPESAQQGRQLRVRGSDHDPALVEQGQHVAGGASQRLAPARPDLLVVVAGGNRLGFRKREPHERVEQIVPAVRPRLHFSSLEDADFVLGGSRGRHEADRRAAAARDPRVREGVELVVPGKPVSREASEQ